MHTFKRWGMILVAGFLLQGNCFAEKELTVVDDLWVAQTRIGHGPVMRGFIKTEDRDWIDDRNLEFIDGNVVGKLEADWTRQNAGVWYAYVYQNSAYSNATASVDAYLITRWFPLSARPGAAPNYDFKPYVNRLGFAWKAWQDRVMAEQAANKGPDFDDDASVGSNFDAMHNLELLRERCSALLSAVRGDGYDPEDAAQLVATADSIIDSANQVIPDNLAEAIDLMNRFKVNKDAGLLERAIDEILSGLDDFVKNNRLDDADVDGSSSLDYDSDYDDSEFSRSEFSQDE